MRISLEQFRLGLYVEVPIVTQSKSVGDAGRLSRTNSVSEMLRQFMSVLLDAQFLQQSVHEFLVEELIVRGHTGRIDADYFAASVQFRGELFHLKDGRPITVRNTTRHAHQTRSTITTFLIGYGALVQLSARYEHELISGLARLFLIIGVL